MPCSDDIGHAAQFLCIIPQIWALRHDLILSPFGSAGVPPARLLRPTVFPPADETSALVRLRGRWDRAVEVRSCAVRSRAVSNRNCVVAMRGGEQRNENDQSVTQADQAGSRRELDSVGVGGRVCERKTKPDTAGVNPLATGRTPVNTQMVGDGMAGSPNGRNQEDPPGTSGVHGGSARRTARRESERP
jgi:hypothetical protein